jgi:hypothetical protein
MYLLTQSSCHNHCVPLEQLTVLSHRKKTNLSEQKMFALYVTGNCNPYKIAIHPLSLNYLLFFLGIKFFCFLCYESACFQSYGYKVRLQIMLPACLIFCISYCFLQNLVTKSIMNVVFHTYE